MHSRSERALQRGRRLGAGALVLGLIALLLAGCSPERTWQSGLILANLAAGPEAGDTCWQRSTASPRQSSAAYTVAGERRSGDLYLPGGGPAEAGLLLVPGAAPEGRKDPRLVQFANTFARAGFAVLVPQIPGLKDLRVEARQIDEIAGAFAFLAGRAELAPGGRAGMGAFSYAVGPALLAAQRKDVRQRVSFVLGVGGYYDLEAALAFSTTGYFRRDGDWRHMTPHPYPKLVLVLSSLPRLRDAGDRKLFRAMVDQRMENREAPIDDLAEQLGPEGRSILALVQNTEPEATGRLIEDLPPPVRRDLRALDPSRRDLSGLRACLILVHGRDDSIVPYSQSIALAEAVPEEQVRLYLLHGLQHVDIDLGELWSPALFTRYLPDVCTMLSAIRALLRQRDGVADCGASSKHE